MEENSQTDFSEWFYKNYRKEGGLTKENIGFTNAVAYTIDGFRSKITPYDINEIIKTNMFVLAYLFKYKLYKPEDSYLSKLNEIFEHLKTSAETDKNDAINNLKSVKESTDIEEIKKTIDYANKKGVDESITEFRDAKNQLDKLEQEKAAAVKVQSAMRGKAARQEKQRREDEREAEKAAEQEKAGAQRRLGSKLSTLMRKRVLTGGSKKRHRKKHKKKTKKHKQIKNKTKKNNRKSKRFSKKNKTKTLHKKHRNRSIHKRRFKNNKITRHRNKNKYR